MYVGIVKYVQHVLVLLYSKERKLKEEFRKLHLVPDITVVSLKTSLQTCTASGIGTGGQQALTIDTQGGPVFFKDLNPDALLDGKNIENKTIAGEKSM